MNKVIYDGGVTDPILLCDICGKKIENLGAASAVFPMGETDGQVMDVFFVHKGACHAKADKKADKEAGAAPWHELQDHFILLIQSSGMTVADLQKRVDDLKGTGIF